MKKRLLFWLASIFSSFLLITSAFAAEGDRLEIIFSPENAKVGEALDLTIKAVDKNGAVIKDYSGSVLIFSNTNPEVVLPSSLNDNTYKFTEADQWVKKFENGVKFTKAWNQTLNIFDYDNEEINGIAEVKISDSWLTGKAEISFISPEEWLTIWEDKIKVSGSTSKNHKVKIILNWTEDYNTNSNNDWVFEKELEKLKKWENIIKAQVLDADNNILWETKELKIKVETNWLSIKSVKVLPEEVFVEWPYNIELISETGLKEVNVLINDSVIKLTEEWNWVYKWSSFAPKNPGNYKVDANLLSDIWHKIEELWVANLKVKELNAALIPEKNSTWEVISEKKERDNLLITWLKLVELKTKSILTWDAIPNVKSYNVYKKTSTWEKELVIKVTEPKFEINIEWDKVKFEDFYISANWQDEQWEYEWLLSDPTKIKTWPEILIILLISLFFAWMFLFFKWKKT